MIICCGEALIDMLPRQSTLDEPAFAPYSGGAVFNTAIALGRLGIGVEFFSGLSSDLFGEQLQASLAQSGVGFRYASVSPRPTTLAFVRLVDGQASYVFYDEATAGRMLSQADLPDLEDDVEALLFGGISLIPEPCGSTYEALMRREAGRRVTMLDPNLRPAFIPDRESHLARIRRMVAIADIVKVSDDDLAWFGEAGAKEDIIARWLDLGPRLIVLTQGAGGATAYSRAAKVTVIPKPVTIVDTVGAGDTFNAGVLASFQEQKALTKMRIANLSEDTIHKALTLGTEVASVTVSRAGANPPWRYELS